jgi:hypothetical protein
VVSGSVNTSRTGTYLITYNVSDAAHNPAEEVTRYVTVVQKGAPLANVSYDIEILTNYDVIATVT